MIIEICINLLSSMSFVLFQFGMELDWKCERLVSVVDNLHISVPF